MKTILLILLLFLVQSCGRDFSVPVKSETCYVCIGWHKTDSNGSRFGNTFNRIWSSWQSLPECDAHICDNSLIGVDCSTIVDYKWQSVNDSKDQCRTPVHSSNLTAHILQHCPEIDVTLFGNNHADSCIACHVGRNSLGICVQ